MKQRTIKTGWHLLLVAASVIEYQIAETQLKKHLSMACAGWHLSAAICDWTEK